SSSSSARAPIWRPRCRSAARSPPDLPESEVRLRRRPVDLTPPTTVEPFADRFPLRRWMVWPSAPRSEPGAAGERRLPVVLREGGESDQAVGGGGDGAAVRAVGGDVDLPGGAFREPALDHWAVGGVADHHGALEIAGGDEGLAVGGEGDAEDGVGETEFAEQSAAGSLPQAQGAVEVAGGHDGAVRGEGDGVDVAGVPVFEATDLAEGGGVPDEQVVIGARGREPVGGRVERDGEDVAPVAGQGGTDLPAGGGPADDHVPGRGAGGDQVAGAVEGHRVIVVAADQLAQCGAGARVPRGDPTVVALAVAQHRQSVP